MSRAALLAACAALLAAGPARAYVRSTDPTTGAGLYWGSRSVSYRINFGRAGTANPAPTAPTCGAPVEQTAVQTGFSQWTGANQGCTDLNLVYDPTPGSSTIGFISGVSNENTVVFRAGWCSDTRIVPANDACWAVDETYLKAHPDQVGQTCANVYNCFDDNVMGRQTLALTTVTYVPRTGQIFDADMELNGWSGADLNTSIPSSSPADAWYFTCTDPTTTVCTTYGQSSPTCAFVDLQNTVTHEAGHFIGLSHTTDPKTTMYAYSGPADFAKRSLDQDDVNGLCSIYPVRHGGGCASTGDGAALSALLLALAALAPRLRRRG